MARKEISTLWNRQNRNDINNNFEELYDALIQSGADAEEARRIAEEAKAAAESRKGYLEENRTVEYPLKNMTFRNETGSINALAKNLILDVKIFGAKTDCYYKLDFVGNGFVSKDIPRYGITLSEFRKRDFETTGYRTQYVFVYNDDDDPANAQNANYEKGSDGIDTVTVDNGEIACSVTVDRAVFGSLQFVNFNTHASSAIIDPSNYFF